MPSGDISRGGRSTFGDSTFGGSGCAALAAAYRSHDGEGIPMRFWSKQEGGAASDSDLPRRKRKPYQERCALGGFFDRLYRGVHRVDPIDDRLQFTDRMLDIKIGVHVERLMPQDVALAVVLHVRHLV